MSFILLGLLILVLIGFSEVHNRQKKEIEALKDELRRYK